MGTCSTETVTDRTAPSPGSCSYVNPRPVDDQVLSSPGGQDEGALHPVDPPAGYHTAARMQSWSGPGGGGIEGCPRAVRAVGLRQVDGMAL